jgi:broad specificity phosphatase PhoE
MTTFRLSAIAWLGLLVSVLACETAESTEPAATLSGAALVRALQVGGYNIYFRHAATDWSQHDDVRRAGDWASCDPSRIRQLSAEGRDTARAVGAAMRALAIPVGHVLASPYCRTVETAQLMALGPVETTTDIMNLRVAEYFGGREAIAERARARLAIAPTPGTNTVLVAHGNVARLATDVYPGEGEGAIFRPLGDGRFEHVGSLLPGEWTRLAEELSGDAASTR